MVVSLPLEFHKPMSDNISAMATSYIESLTNTSKGIKSFSNSGNFRYECSKVDHNKWVVMLYNVNLLYVRQVYLFNFDVVSDAKTGEFIGYKNVTCHYFVDDGSEMGGPQKLLYHESFIVEKTQSISNQKINESFESLMIVANDIISKIDECECFHVEHEKYSNIFIKDRDDLYDSFYVIPPYAFEIIIDAI